MNQRLNSLKAQKGRIDQEIDSEMSRPYPDGLRLQRLKRQRLRLKDMMFRIGRLMARGRSDGVPA